MWSQLPGVAPHSSLLCEQGFDQKNPNFATGNPRGPFLPQENPEQKFSPLGGWAPRTDRYVVFLVIVPRIGLFKKNFQMAELHNLEIRGDWITTYPTKSWDPILQAFVVESQLPLPIELHHLPRRQWKNDVLHDLHRLHHHVHLHLVTPIHLRSQLFFFQGPTKIQGGKTTATC